MANYFADEEEEEYWFKQGLAELEKFIEELECNKTTKPDSTPTLTDDLTPTLTDDEWAEKVKRECDLIRKG